MAVDSAAVVVGDRDVADPEVEERQLADPEADKLEATDLEAEGTDVVKTTPTAPAKAAPARNDEAREFFDKRTP
ncbi:hypothetical protein ACRQ5B_12065 [Pseudarthrobacter sp. L19]|uniref:hypothetical protein n=1 Tax=Pseudarthrobacter sp. L19 TaxID=3423951 RepID=UPI003D7A3CA6